MSSFRRWAINNGFAIGVVVFAFGYTGCNHLFPRPSIEYYRQNEVTDIFKETILEELSETFNSRKFSDNNLFDFQVYQRTNNQGLIEIDFDAFARDLAIVGHKEIISSNMNSATAKLTQSGYVRGLKMALDIFEEAKLMQRR